VPVVVDDADVEQPSTPLVMVCRLCRRAFDHSVNMCADRCGTGAHLCVLVASSLSATSALSFLCNCKSGYTGSSSCGRCLGLGFHITTAGCQTYDGCTASLGEYECADKALSDIPCNAPREIVSLFVFVSSFVCHLVQKSVEE